MSLGGRSGEVAYLAFQIPQRGRGIARATLSLSLHPSGSPVLARRLLVHSSAPFRGSDLTHASAPTPGGAPVAQAEVAPGTRRPIRLDLTAALRRAIVRGEPRLTLVLRTDGTDRPLRLASPHAVERQLRPRLSILRP